MYAKAKLYLSMHPALGTRTLLLLLLHCMPALQFEHYSCRHQA
jgi:hypothetical protein